MIETKTKYGGRQFSLNKSILIAIILIVLAVLGLYGFNAFKASQVEGSQSGEVSISQRTLEEDYGLRVQLVAVTAAGGLVDLRLQIVNAEKAKAFLDDRANFPALRLENGVVLRPSEDVATQEIQFENSKTIFILFPNAGNVLKPSDTVNIVFGDTEVEAIEAK